MRKTIVLALGLFAFCPVQAPAAEYTGEGSIGAVTVYRDRASVTRDLKIEFATGSHAISIPGLPPRIDEDSLRVRATGQAPITIHNVRISTTERTDSSDPKVAGLIGELEKLTEKIKQLDLMIESRKTQIEFLKTLTKARAESAGKDLTSATPAAPPTAEELGKIVDFIFNKRMEAEFANAATTKQRTEVVKEYDKVRRELGNLRGMLNRRTKTVTVDFSASRAGKGTFTLEYIVPNAGWAPSYTIHADTQSSQVLVSYAANVWQRTGEDWKNVKLTLSTAAPRVGAKAPKPEPWIVDQRRPRPLAKAMAPAPGRQARKYKAEDRAVAAMEVLEEAEQLDAAVAQTTVESTGTAVTFATARRESVLSGSDRTKVTVGELDFKSKSAFFSAPKLSPHVYLRSKFTNSADYPMLAGPIFVFLKGNYVGRGSIKSTAPGQEMEMDLGVDNGFTIKRKLVKKESGDEGVISRKHVVRYVFEIEAESHKKKPVTVEITDPLPLPRHDSIVVRDVKIAPKPEKKDEKNILTWKLPLNPGQKKTIRIEFSLEYPRDMPVTGID